MSTKGNLSNLDPSRPPERDWPCDNLTLQRLLKARLPQDMPMFDSAVVKALKEGVPWAKQTLDEVRAAQRDFNLVFLLALQNRLLKAELDYLHKRDQWCARRRVSLITKPILDLLRMKPQTEADWKKVSELLAQHEAIQHKHVETLRQQEEAQRQSKQDYVPPWPDMKRWFPLESSKTIKDYVHATATRRKTVMGFLHETQARPVCVPSEKRRGRPGNCYDLTTTLAVLVEWLKCWLPHQQGATDPRTKRILSQVAAYAMLGSAAETGEPPEVIHKLRQAVKPFLKPIPGFELPVLSAAELEILGRLK